MAARGGGGSARFGPVVVSRMSAGSGEWTAEQAVDVLEQGYGVDRVAELTGFDRRWVAAQRRRQD